MILSVSRRSDIPAFYAEWFYNRLKDGYMYKYDKKNNCYEKVVLKPNNVDCIVFWTKNPAPLMKYLKQFRQMGFEFYFQFTITPYSNDIENNVNDKKDILKTFKELSKMIGKERVIWRYDPILINSKYSVEFHKKAFNQLSNALKGYTDECVISFVDSFNKGKQIAYYEAPDENQVEELCRCFSQAAAKNNMKLKTCAEKADLSKYGIEHGACIDKEKIESLISYEIEVKKDKSQRSACNCVTSYDVGEYFSCLHNCSYCYAGGTDKVKCEYNFKRNIPTSPLFFDNPNEKTKVVKKRMDSLVKNTQTSFF